MNDLQLATFRSGTFSAEGPPITRALFQPAAAYLAYAAAKRNTHPNAVTLAGLALALAGAAVLALQPGAWMLAAGLLLCLGYLLDCVDGQVARATMRTSRLGGWLDVTCDLAVSCTLGAAIMAACDSSALGFAGAACFATGRVLSVTAATSARQSDASPLAVRGSLQAARSIYVLVTDTPTIYTSICGLAYLSDAVLALGSVVLGSLMVVQAVTIGIRTNRAPGPLLDG